MNPLDTYFVNQSHNPGKLTFVNASFWEKRTAIHKPRRPFNFDLKTYPSRTILREVSRVSSLILRAKPWLAKKVLRHGNRFVARVRRRYFSEGEKRRPEMRLRFAGYLHDNMSTKHFRIQKWFKKNVDFAAMLWVYLLIVEPAPPPPPLPQRYAIAPKEEY